LTVALRPILLAECASIVRLVANAAGRSLDAVVVKESPQIRIRWSSEPISGLDMWILGALMSVVAPTVRLRKPCGCRL
jgi:hypothetical protein